VDTEMGIARLKNLIANRRKKIMIAARKIEE
jgi:hypothetical protein